MSTPDQVVVWGNCQAAPLGDLLRAALGELGLQVVDLTPVYLLDERGVREVHELMARTALLISQPLRDEYRIPGCSMQALAALLPDDGRLISVPVVYSSVGLPYQVTVNDADGVRVNAPRTDYHDLRLLIAAAAGRSADEVLERWPTRASDDAVRANAAASQTEIRRREAACNIAVSDLLTDPRAMFTLDHPSNTVLTAVARRVLVHLGAAHLTGSVVTPKREYLGAIRTPVESPDAPVDASTDWTIWKEPIGWDVIVTEHLEWYRSRADVVADGLAHNETRARRLGLG